MTDPIVTAIARQVRGCWILELTCPHCGETHTHGGGADDTPSLGHRVAHCRTGHGRGYFIELDATEAVSEPPIGGLQTMQVCNLLRRCGPSGLTVTEARKHGVMHLPRRIKDLRERGFVIDAHPLAQRAEDGKAHRTKRYVLIAEPRTEGGAA